MIKIKNVGFYQNILVINCTYRFNNPQVIIKTWYGIKVISGGSYRFFTFNEAIKKRLLEKLTLNETIQKKDQ